MHWDGSGWVSGTSLIAATAAAPEAATAGKGSGAGK
jgi:hypothetical protein